MLTFPAQSDYFTFLKDWAQITAKGGVDPLKRPEAPTILFDNTTIIGSWISKEWSNITQSYSQFNRVIDNVTMAMPHAGVFAAAQRERDILKQPQNLAGMGEYRLRASVMSPAINVLCVNMNKTELAPLIYITWPNAKFNTGEQIPGQRMPLLKENWVYEAVPVPGEDYLNSTVVDNIFEWGASYLRQPPAFPMYPDEYNSIVNVSLVYALTDSIYALFKAPDIITKDYTLCKLRSGNFSDTFFSFADFFLVFTPKCSTHYNVSGTTGSRMRSNCDDPDDNLAYHISVPDAPTIQAKDWITIGSELVRALSFGAGISDGYIASSRLVTQLITKEPAMGIAERNRLMLSISESLAVMAGSTLLLSSTDAGFYHYWNFTEPILDREVLLPFNASVQSQEYASGFVQRWTILFYIVLFIVFFTNIFCLIYFFLRSGLVTDYSEPQNLFALAVNSPISRRLFGSCGAGPEGGQFNIDWHIVQDNVSGHFFIKEGDADTELTRWRQNAAGPGELKSTKSYSRLSSGRKTWL